MERHKGIAVQERRGKKRRWVFGEKIIELPPQFKFRRNIAVQTFQIADNLEGRWESLYDESNTVLIAPLTKRGKLVLVEIFRYPLHNTCLELPGGEVRKRETMQSAARRELREETGYSSREDLIYLGRGPLYSGGANGLYYIFALRNCMKTHEPELDPVEKTADLNVKLFSPGELFKQIMNDNRGYHIDPQVYHALLMLILSGMI